MSEISPASEAKTLAVLIDADNASLNVLPQVLAEIATYGIASVKRIYGDWSSRNLGGWRDQLLAHSIQPIQQFAYTKGKNATDIAMIIDAMDLLYTGRFSGFCLVTSDSDFTPLAARIREQGLTVYGFGEKKTPEPFVRACDKFIYTEVLNSPDEHDSNEDSKPIKQMSGPELRKDGKLLHRIRKAVDTATGEEAEWASLGEVGSHLSKLMPDFDARNYGYAKLSELIKALDLFELSRKDKHVQIRPKPKKS
ncbi:NYN domain-containing protein [Luteolibacter marinus]|uniref:NYN domain-containing protein n=1 Tax=Luteolibacter marinus TaxID=2776705 RepID=UPI001866562C|nr:NYN domain-containing protein [Luteolibacter marinus]